MSTPHRIGIYPQIALPFATASCHGDGTPIYPGRDDKIYPVVKIATILNSLAAEGAPTAEVLAAIDLSKSAAASPETRVSLNQVLECCRMADRLSHDPYFAYRTGLGFHVSAYGIYGCAMLCSTNFRQTMRFIVEYHQLATPLAETCFNEEGKRGVWTFSPLPHPGIDARLYKFLVELQFGIHLSLQRDFMGPTFTAQELHVTYRPPDNAAKYSEILGCEVLFGQPQNKFLFDAAWLDKKPELGNQITYSIAVKLCDSLLEELRLRIDVVGKVRHCVLINLMQPKRLDDVASHLNMSTRTLRRKLREEHTSFRKVANELRMEMAIKYLRDTGLTVEDIAHMLGFSDAANFRQAFRRWTNMAPQRFRSHSARLDGDCAT